MFNLFGRKKKELSIRVSPARNIQQKPIEKKELPAEKRTIEEMEKVEGNKKAIEIFKKIKDPELDIDIWSLGLVYDIEIKGNNVNINLTFTSPMCPAGEQIIRDVNLGLKKIGLEPKVNLVFNPPWEASQELRDILGV